MLNLLIPLVIGMVAMYILKPHLDNLIEKIKSKVKK